MCALLGPRQCGKTTIAKEYAGLIKKKIHFFDCENPLHLAKLVSPMLTLGRLERLIIIGEVQLRTDLFSVIRVLVDENKNIKFLITGSASRDLIRQSSETLAGRVGYHQITPFNIREADDWKKLWLRGGFPRSYLANSDKSTEIWRDEYIKTFLERDILNLGLEISSIAAGKLWWMLSFMHGQILNIDNLSAALSLDRRTIFRYLNVLEGVFMITILRPWHSNLKKREVKSAKIYIRDSGILYRLLRLSVSDEEFPDDDSNNGSESSNISTFEEHIKP